MLFKNIIGQPSIKKNILQTFSNNKLPHAILFLSHQGNGDLPLALALAQYVNCENKQENDSCGQCPSCNKSQKLIHPDIHYSYPVVTKKSGDKPKSTDYLPEWREALIQNPYLNIYDWLQFVNAENKQGNITVEECHDIIRKLNFKTYESKYKVMIIWMAEFLGNASNTLLKIIEEPPDNTLFILIAHQHEKILPTILSRTQIFQIPKLNDEEISFALIDKLNVEESEAQSIAQMADGNYHEAVELLNNFENNLFLNFSEWINICLKNDGVVITKWVDNFSKSGRENQKQFFIYALHFFREYLIFKIQTNNLNSIKLNTQEKELVNEISGNISIEHIELIIPFIDKSHFHIERNANPKILFLNLSIQLANIFKNKEVNLYSY